MTTQGDNSWILTGKPDGKLVEKPVDIVETPVETLVDSSVRSINVYTVEGSNTYNNINNETYL